MTSGLPSYLDPSGTPTWPVEYPQEFQTMTPQLGGYAYHNDGQSPAGYYTTGSRMRYDFHDPALVPRGLLLATRDALDAESRTEYDVHDFLPVRAIDALGLPTEAVIDYRVLAPQRVTDVNGNSASVTFSPAGFVTETFVRGKDGQGDAVLPSVRAEYDLHAFAQRRQPVHVRSVRRVHHDTATDVPPAQRDEVIVSVEYSDGFGRLLQTRTQAEDTLFGDPLFGDGVLPIDQTVPVPPPAGRTRDPGDPLNVVVSGWQVYDNKGRVVHKYEPFFGTGFDYATPGERQMGRKTVMFYDPRGQLVRTLNPDGSQQRVVFGVPADLADPESFAPTAWESYSYDANDNAGRTHGTAAQAYASHWNTPASVTIDALGRVVEAVARNGSETIVTRSTYDIQGNLLSIIDPLGRPAFQYRYDLMKRVWRSDSIDAGRRDCVHDALGRVVESRDAKGALGLSGFDIAHRPIRQWARDNSSTAVLLRQRIEYGDGSDPNQPAAQREAARAQNLLGRPVRHNDEAGLAAVTDADFKGNVLESARWVVADAPILAAYAQAASQGWRVDPFRTDWNPKPGQTRAEREAELLEPVAYLSSTRYDALNRVTLQFLPTDVEARRRELRPFYNRAGGLERVLLDDTVYVEQIAYDAKGQRTLITYGNGITTRYAYDPDTFRLARLRTDRQGAVLQDYGYRYDLAGNLLTIRDRTPGGGLPVTPDALDRRFTYDPIYRLLSATGRESDDPPPSPPWTVVPRNTDVTKTRAYSETYTYNANNSLTQMAHKSSVGFTRDLTVDAASNRLQRMTIGSTPFDYAYDPNGNMVSETAARHYTWDHADRLHTFATQTAGAEPSVHAHYLYDATGERIKKLVRRQGGTVEVTHYVGGFEHHRWGTGSASQNNHVHVMDDEARIALVRIGPAGPGDQSPAIAFLLADHLGSSTVTIDGAGQVTNREEYTPYGETSFGSYTRKRYRYTGKERDEESGLNYHGARYCLAWTARWASCDPIGPQGGLNQYTYAACNPVKYVDPAGTSPKKTGDGKESTKKPINHDGVKPGKSERKRIKATQNEPYTRGTPPGRGGKGPAQIGNVARYRDQPPAVYDFDGNRCTEGEHIMPKAQLQLMTSNPLTGKPDYTDTHYTNDATMRWERETALAKTSGNGLGDQADNPTTKALKKKVAAGGVINYRKDIFLRSFESTLDAQPLPRSLSTLNQAVATILEQDGNLFALQTPQQSGAIVAAIDDATKAAQVDTKPSSPGGGGRGKLAAGGLMGLVMFLVSTSAQAATTGEAPDPGTVAVDAVSIAVPQAALVTAKNDSEIAVPIICMFAWKLCAVGAVGAGVAWTARETVDAFQKGIPAFIEYSSRARRQWRPF